MPEPIDLFFSFRSPFSALASHDYVRLAAEYDVRIILRPVLPLAVRRDDFFRPENRPWMEHVRLDARRRAAFLGRTLIFPTPDPVVIDLATMTIARNQPHIHRLTRLGVEAERQGHGLGFAAAVSQFLFGGAKGWDQGDQLAKAVAGAGLDLAAMEAALDGGDHDAEITANQQALTDAGHWGVPTGTVRGEPFFGQDRVETLRWRLDQLGVSRRK